MEHEEYIKRLESLLISIPVCNSRDYSKEYEVVESLILLLIKKEKEKERINGT